MNPFTRTTSNTVVPALLLAVLPARTTRPMGDWSKVQVVASPTRIRVQLYRDEAPPQSRQVRGRFHSATPDSVTLTLPDGTRRTLQKGAVRKVLTRRPLSKRLPGWAVMGITAAILEFFLTIDGQPRPHVRARSHAMITLPIGAAFLYGSRMGGIYSVPAKHRQTQPSGTRPPDTEERLQTTTFPGEEIGIQGSGRRGDRAAMLVHKKLGESEAAQAETKRDKGVRTR